MGYFSRSAMFATTMIMVLVFSAPQARADAWGASLAAARMKQMMEYLQRSIEGALLGSMKVAAVQMLNSQVGQLIGGGSLGQALFITNYDTFLYQDPLRQANLHMNDFFTLSTRGKGSSANYISAGGASGIGGNYANYLVSQARLATVDSGKYPTGNNLDEYTPSPTQMFAEGDWRAFNAFFSNPANNPFGYTLMAQQTYSAEIARQQDIQRVKAQASGFLPKEQGGMVLAPAAAIEALTTDVQTLGNKIIAAAQNPAELASGVIAAVANKYINQMVQQGIGQIQANIQREIGNVTSQINGALNEATQALGPAASFLPSVASQLNVNAGSGAPPLPAASEYSGTASCSQKGGTCISNALSCDSGQTQTSDACFSSSYKCCMGDSGGGGGIGQGGSCQPSGGTVSGTCQPYPNTSGCTFSRGLSDRCASGLRCCLTAQ